MRNIIPARGTSPEPARLPRKPWTGRVTQKEEVLNTSLAPRMESHSPSAFPLPQSLDPAQSPPRSDLVLWVPEKRKGVLKVTEGTFK